MSAYPDDIHDQIGFFVDAPRTHPVASYSRFGKRTLDLTLVILALPLWLPLILMAAAVVALDGHSPFYRQPRVGRGGRVFRMWKLRSMVPGADALLARHLASDPEARAEWDDTQKLRCDPRITRFGRFLRKSSMDELPQVINVLTGEMSLVGPRPMLPAQQVLYPGSRYYAMRPGLTGFWQISDRNQCRFRDRARFDDAYWMAQTLRTDATVLLRTVGVVLRGTGC
ncbi:sugar transferase [Jannaschia seohaensis]|uniref:Lipopolysaccharide/colanic/teichoic acid biosynthesis glycosyltransferase n=1 Tax=Jannaschia seohaensis TaxID=475081 RepID=A0A2Y9B2B5_9RHOB|nr:sugar transferase [Jannaschia seohaensis]PWJ12872.1 lipopolysaccharide/colanic/teichoic acid biosynthesis glycosyltransferase [Jannaschia seohaensis]SSA50680.1 Sugar transferase involved in LPS biosynthesis (colanic, teichoic acid) [Jannaschia seohaensis]